MIKLGLIFLNENLDVIQNLFIILIDLKILLEIKIKHID